MNKTAEESWRVAFAINEETAEVRSRRFEYYSVQKNDFFPRTERIRRKFSLYFIFAVTFPDGSERRRTKASLDLSFSLFFHLRPHRFARVDLSLWLNEIRSSPVFDREARRCQAWRLPSKCDGEFRTGQRGALHVSVREKD